LQASDLFANNNSSNERSFASNLTRQLLGQHANIIARPSRTAMRRHPTLALTTTTKTKLHLNPNSRGGGGCDAFGIELAQSRRFSSSGLSLAFAYNRRLPQVTPVSWCFRLTTQKVVLQADEGSEVIPSRARVKRRSRKTRGEWNRRLRVTSIDVSFYALCNDYRM
jgi:hypothetical protein